MIIEIVPFFDFPQEVVLELRPDDWSNLQQEIELFDEVLAEDEIRSGHIILDDIVESAICWVAHEVLLFEFVDIQIQIFADRRRFLALGLILNLSTFHFLLNIRRSIPAELAKSSKDRFPPRSAKSDANARFKQ